MLPQSGMIVTNSALQSVLKNNIVYLLFGYSFLGLHKVGEKVDG